MKADEIKGIVNDLSNYSDYAHPLSHIWLANRFEINLLNGEVSYIGEDDISSFYKEKRAWFIKRVKALKGKLSDFEKAKIVAYGAREKIEILYNGKKFENETIHNMVGKEINELREGIKKMKAEKIRLN